MVTDRGEMRWRAIQPIVEQATREDASDISKDALMSRRSSALDWEEMQHDIALIERRARAMRAEAVWSVARAVREWMITGLGRAPRKPQSAAKSAEGARFPRTGHAV